MSVRCGQRSETPVHTPINGILTSTWVDDFMMANAVRQNRRYGCERARVPYDCASTSLFPCGFSAMRVYCMFRFLAHVMCICVDVMRRHKKKNNNYDEVVKRQARVW